MIPAWRRNIIRGERRTRPIPVKLAVSLGPIMRTKFFDEAEAMRLHPNQLATQIIEAWLVDRKKILKMPDEHYTAQHVEEAV